MQGSPTVAGHGGGHATGEAPQPSGEAAQQPCSPHETEGAVQDGEYDPELGQWMVRALNKIQPGAELTMGSIKTLTALLDGITQRILEEAKQISNGDGAGQEGAAVPESDGDVKPLTSLDIHKALKRVLPEDLRPYLPAVTKQAWHMDKQSIKGVKRLKAAPAPLKQAAPGKENGSEAAPAAGQQLT